MSSFTETFGGSPVSPADVAYASFTFNSNLILYWPQFAAGQTNVAARFMKMSATANSLNVYMPDATLNSTGYDAIIFNAGADTFNVVTFGGNAIVTVAPGQAQYLMLTDNTTQDGTWLTIQFGVGTGAADAAALAGAGLLAIAGLLNVNFNGILVSNDYSITSVQRAVLQVWTGGAGIITLPTAASVGNGFFFPLANNGSGSVVVTTTGGDQIDGASSSTFSQTQSGFILSTGTSWVTVGKGIQNTFSVTLLNLNVAGSSDITETSAQAQNIIQQYTGIITGNINIIMPNTVQIYFVYNNTNGAFSLTVKTAAGSGIVVVQGQHSILYCDGTNIVNAFTASLGGNIGIVPGSSISPSLFIQGSSSTGLYSPVANQIAVSANSFEVMNFTSAPSSVNYLQSQASATGSPVVISALGGDANIGITLTPKGTGAINIPKANITGGLGNGITLDNSIIGSITPAAITGTTITANTGFVGNLTGNVVGNLTGNITGGSATFSSTITPSSTNGIVGTTTNDSANSGSIGEYISSTLASGSAVILSTGAPHDVTSISLTAGDWDVWGVVCFLPTGSGSQQLAWTSTTSATIPIPPNNGAWNEINFAPATTGGTPSLPIGVQRINIPSTTTVYLSAEATFSTGAVTAFGFIGARRVR